MTYFNEFGQARLGWNVGVPSGGITPSTLWTNIYAVYNADSVGSSSLKTSLYAAYNGESNANDSFGSNNGTDMGGLTYTTGKIGNAFNFNGSTSYVQLGDVLDVGTSSWSYSMWFKANQLTAGTYLVLFSKSIAASGAGRVWVTTYGNQLQFNFDAAGNANNINTQTTLTFNTNTWYHIVCVLDRNDKLKMYVNGTLVVLNTILGDNNLIPYSAVNYNTNNPFRIGTYTAADNTSILGTFNGQIDAFNIWNRVLTQSEITELYNSGNGAQYITDNFYKPTTNDALNTYNGTAQGGLTYGVGKVGTAFQFNGSNAYVDMGDVLDVGTSSWTYNFWVYPTNLSFARTVFCKTTYGTPANSLDFWFDSALMRFFIVLDSSNYISIRDNSTVLQGSTWQNITVVIDRTDKIKLYYNGVLSTNIVNFGNVNNNSLSSFSGTNIQSNFPFRIGASNSNTASLGQFFQGNIDSFNVWNRALTQSEITELYNSGNGKQYPN